MISLKAKQNLRAIIEMAIQNPQALDRILENTWRTCDKSNAGILVSIGPILDYINKDSRPSLSHLNKIDILGAKLSNETAKRIVASAVGRH